jgi:hypothetical protein
VKHLLRVCVLAALAAAASGCPQPNEMPPRGAQVDQITLLALPTALNWDGRPGPDGVQTVVHLFQQAAPQPVLINGTLEFLLYEGRVSRDELSAAKPFHVWPFTAAQLEPYVGRSKVGWGYALRLPWGPTMPRSSSVTLAARYTPPGAGAPTVYSAPTTIAMKPS